MHIMKTVFPALCIAWITGFTATGAEQMINMFEGIPYTEDRKSVV